MEGLEQIQESLAAHRVAGQFRYSSPLRKRIVRFVEQARAAGHAQAAISEALGVPWGTLARWMADADPHTPQATAAMLPVVIDHGDISTAHRMRPVVRRVCVGRRA